MFGFGMSLTIPVMNLCEKYPMERVWLSKFCKTLIAFSGSWLSTTVNFSLSRCVVLECFYCEVHFSGCDERIYFLLALESINVRSLVRSMFVWVVV